MGEGDATCGRTGPATIKWEGGRGDDATRGQPPPPRRAPNKVSYRPSPPLDFQLIVVVDGGMSYLPTQRERRSDRHTHNQDTMQRASWLVATFFGVASHGLARRGRWGRVMQLVGGRALPQSNGREGGGMMQLVGSLRLRAALQTRSPTGHPPPSIFS